MAMVACHRYFWIAVTERGGLMVYGNNDDGQLGLGSQVAARRPRALGGPELIADEGAAELVGGIDALALHAGDAPEAPAAALLHPFESKVAMVATGEEHSVCVTDDGAVWAYTYIYRYTYIFVMYSGIYVCMYVCMHVIIYVSINIEVCVYIQRCIC